MRILKKLIIYTTIIGASLASILVVFGFIYQEEIVKSVQVELNKTLNAEIRVPKMDLSFISNFPHASIRFYNITGLESKNYASSLDTLFHFDQVETSFNLMGVLNGKYQLEEIHAENGFVNLEINSQGEQNFQLFKEDTTETSEFELNLQQVNLDNVTVGYQDHRNSDVYRFSFPDIVAKGTITESTVSAALYGTTQVEALEVDGVSYLNKELGRVDIGIEYDIPSNRFLISRGFITLRDQYNFEVKGRHSSKKYAYEFTATKMDLERVEEFIPKKYTRFLSTYNLDGEADAVLSIVSNDSKSPIIKGSYALTNGVFENTNSNEILHIPVAQGTFDMGSRASLKTTTITAEKIVLETTEGSGEGSFSITNLNSPAFKLNVKGNADLNEINNLINVENQFQMGGEVDFEIRLDGRLKSADTITLADINTFKGRAKVHLKNGALLLEGFPEIKGLDMEGMVSPDIFQANKLSGQISTSMVSGNAQITNWLGYITSPAYSLIIESNLQMDQFLLKDWVTESEDSTSVTTFPRNLLIKSNVKCGHIEYEKIALDNFSGIVKYRPTTLSIINGQFRGFDGEVLSNMTLDQTSTGYNLKGDVTTRKVDLKKLLLAFDNFEQDVVTAKQIEGELTTQFDFSIQSNQQFKWMSNTLNLEGDVMILNGELNENKLLYSIPSEIEKNKIIALFVNLDAFEQRLHRISFDTISNHLVIKNSRLEIPEMTIKSSALTLNLRGWHSFDNELDYYMNFNLKEVLHKGERIDSDYGYLAEDPRGNRMMYLHVYTKNGEFEVDLDKMGSKNRKQWINTEEVNTAKAILQDELGLFKNDTTLSVPVEEDVFEYELDLGEFGDTAVTDTTKVDTFKVKSDSTKTKGKNKKKKKKKEEESEFEEFDFEDDDY